MYPLPARLQIYKLPPVAGAGAAHPSVDSNYSQRIVGGPRHPEVITRLTFSPIGRQGYLAPRTLQGRHSSLPRESRGEKGRRKGWGRPTTKSSKRPAKSFRTRERALGPPPNGMRPSLFIRGESSAATPRDLLAVMGRGGLY